MTTKVTSAIWNLSESVGLSWKIQQVLSKIYLQKSQKSRPYIRVAYNFNSRIETEGLLKIVDRHIHWTNINVSEKVHDTDVIITDL